MGRAGNGASNVGAVAVRVDVGAAGSVESEGGTAAAELRVGGTDTSVDDVAEAANTSGVVVDVSGGGVAGGDGSETPGSAGLLGQGEDGPDLVGLDLGDLWACKWEVL